ncbi:MAG: protein-L-isoaspartate O-methyltransferase [Hyphomicrobiaceae bacterium]|nr:protein-L-isoaspartate O-methyltransferase [Hyphomicrobiaceae bacterium]
MVDAAEQRRNMVDSQLRPSDVTDRRIIRAMLEIPRENFSPSAMRALAYMDEDLVVQAGDRDAPMRHVLAPRTQALLLQLAQIESGDLVLDVGCATGYSTAIAARLADSVVAVEQDARLVERASALLSTLGIDNAAILAGPLNEGMAGQGPYDVIVLNGAVEVIPESLFAQLKPGGRLVAVLIEGRRSRAVVATRRGGKTDVRATRDLSAPSLTGFQKAAGFVF